MTGACANDGAAGIVVLSSVVGCVFAVVWHDARFAHLAATAGFVVASAVTVTLVERIVRTHGAPRSLSLPGWWGLVVGVTTVNAVTNVLGADGGPLAAAQAWLTQVIVVVLVLVVVAVATSRRAGGPSSTRPR